MSRSAQITRATRETSVTLELGLDGHGAGTRDTGVGFLDHMLDLLARHARLDLDVKVTGDLETGGHHTVEDTAIVPMDEARAIGTPAAASASSAPWLIRTSAIRRQKLLGPSAEAKRADPPVGRTWLEPAT